MNRAERDRRSAADGNPVLTLHVTKGLDQVLQLDAATEMYREFGTVEVEHQKGNLIAVTAPLRVLEVIVADTHRRAFDSGWDQPMWYAACARANYKRLVKEIVALGKVELFPKGVQTAAKNIADGIY